MRKSDLVSIISSKTGIDRVDVKVVIDSFSSEIRAALESGNNVYMRGFGSFVIKRRAGKIARNISKGTSVSIPPHNIPAFRPADDFLNAVKTKVSTK